jgi:hypothetical protein
LNWPRSGVDQQTHLRGDMACEHIAEIAGRHRETRARSGAPNRNGVEMEQPAPSAPRPVDRVRRQRQRPIDLAIGKHPLHHRLCVVKLPWIRDIVVDVRRKDRCHPPLYIGHALMRVDHEGYFDLVAPGDGVDRS